MEVKFYDKVDDIKLKYAIIISKCKEKYVLCKHKERDTYEIPGGHREIGEAILETAKRELREETGALEFYIKPICVYSVKGHDGTVIEENESFGMLYYADIINFENEIHSEIEKIEFFDDLSNINWTYAIIHPKLIEKFQEVRVIDVFGKNRFEKNIKFREACRGIVISNGEILLSYEANNDQWMIPGGGVEGDESNKDCCIRELKEETGYIVSPKKHLLTMNEYYKDWCYISHYFLCDIIDNTERKLTDEEIKNGLVPKWIPLNDAIEIFSKYQDYRNDENKMKIGLYLREYRALSEIIKMIDI